VLILNNKKMGNVNLDVLKQKFEELFNENNKEST